MPVLTVPLALLGLAALPALGAIYLLRNRYRRQSVSSLMLWVDQREAREGGSRVQRLRMPWLVLLELAVLAALVLAAVGPKVLASGAAPMVVVLDDSFSMGAVDGSGHSARARGIEAVEAAVGGGGARFVLAGRTPRLMGDGEAAPGEGGRWAGAWRCQSPGSDLEAALRLAGEVGAAGARVLVVTDRPPPEGLDEGRVRWRAVGRPSANTAMVNAARAAGPGGERLLLEIANYADEARRTTLTLRGDGAAEDEGAGADGETMQPLGAPRLIEIDPGERRRLVLDLPPGVGAIEATLDDDDALSIDNTVTLLAENERELGVALAIGNAKLGQHVRRALRATGRVRFEGPAELWISDDIERSPSHPAAWPIYVRTGEASGGEAAAYMGPFIIDRRHPIGEGLGLAGVIWAAPEPAKTSGDDEATSADAAPDASAAADGSDTGADTGSGDGGPNPPATDLADLPGLPIVAAGNRTLLSVAGGLSGRRTVHMAFDPGASTLQRAVSWPVLWANLVDWRLAAAPGLDHANVRLGDRVRLIVQRTGATLGADADAEPPEASITAPDGSTAGRAVNGRAVVVAANAPGRWRVAYEGRTFDLAANALAAAESDVRSVRSGRWGDWLNERSVRDQYVSVAWVVALAALALLGWHQWLVHRESGGRAS